jgi:predicted GNAT superfamily acetyltransferase
LGAAPPSEFVVRGVASPDELKLCVGLYEEVFRLGPGDGSINTRLLVGIVRNSGIVVGAFAGARMVGFALSFLAYDREKELMYQYSQLAVVADAAQGMGIGRRLKLAQRDAARSMGISLMRWSFDPFLVRNAHFNLNVLGARAFKLERDLYGSHGHGLDVEESTDRLLAEWDLSVESPQPREAAPGGALGVAKVTGERAALAVPALSPRTLDESARALRAEMLDGFDTLFDLGFVAVGCDLESDERAVYSFEKMGTS